MDLVSLERTRVLVNGSSRGLGRVMAVSLASAGGAVVCASTSPGGTDGIIRTTGRQA